jgi:glyoxylase-like metal-dependent hydrolase (beta-lactamase superfamily II)
MARVWPTATTELAPGVFSYVQATGGFCIANAGVIDDPRGATVIDALFTPTMTRALLDEAQRLAASPVARLINTHHHVDHTLGNAHFPADTTILAHARAKAEMQRVGTGVLNIIKRMAPHFEAELEGASERLPDATFDGEALDLDIGGKRARLLHLGTGHTRGDVLVHLPEHRILFAGDVAFFNVTPLAFEGHIGNWIRVCDRVLAMDDVDVIVPGHGPVGGKDDLREMRGYLQLVHDGARRAYDAGASEDEARASIDLGAYESWGESERVSFNVARVYAELRGELTLD